MGVSSFTEEEIEARGTTCFCPLSAALPFPPCWNCFILIFPAGLCALFSHPCPENSLALSPQLPCWVFQGRVGKGLHSNTLGSVLCADLPGPHPAPTACLEPASPRPSPPFNLWSLPFPTSLLTVPFPTGSMSVIWSLGSCQASSGISSINSPGSCLAARAHQKDRGLGVASALLEPPPA